MSWQCSDLAGTHPADRFPSQWDKERAGQCWKAELPQEVQTGGETRCIRHASFEWGREGRQCIHLFGNGSLECFRISFSNTTADRHTDTQMERGPDLYPAGQHTPCVGLSLRFSSAPYRRSPCQSPPLSTARPDSYSPRSTCLTHPTGPTQMGPPRSGMRVSLLGTLVCPYS